MLGYVSTARVLLALEQGEVDGSFTVGNALASRKAQRGLHTFDDTVRELL